MRFFVVSFLVDSLFSVTFDFFQKSGVDIADFARLNVRFVRTKSFSLVSAFAIACMFSSNRFSADVAGELLASSMIR